MAKHKKILLLLLVVFLSTSYFLGYSPLLLSLIFTIVSLLTYLAYAKDKSAASKGEWRVPEKTLHLLSLFFGWPGAMIAQERLRHKTKKVSFRIIFWMTVLVNVGLLSAMLSPEGQRILIAVTDKLEHLIQAGIRSCEVHDVFLLLVELRG